MKKIKNLFLIMSVFAFAAIGLSSCGSSNNNGSKSDEAVTLKYLNFTAQPNYIKQLNQMVSVFEIENPNIKIDVETVPYDSYFTKLQTLLAGGTAPDTYEVNYENFVSYASKGSLLDLSKYVSDDKTLDLKDVNQKAFDAPKYDGKQYGLTEAFSNVVTYYNKDMFDKAKVAYPNANWKWADELAAAKKLTDASNKIYGTYSPVTMNEFYKVAAQNGGSIYDANGNLTINSPANVAALQHMVDLVVKDKVSPTPAQMSGQQSEDLFLNGQLAMVHTGIWDFATFKDAKFKWDIAVEAGNTQKATHFFADIIAVSSDTKNPDAAYKWAKFMSTSKEVAKIRVDSSYQLPIVNSPDVLKTYLDQRPPSNRQAVFDSLNYLVLPPVNNNWQKLADAADKEFEKVLLGQESAQNALDNLEQQFK